MTKIKIPWAAPYFAGKEQEYLAKALESTWISSGYYVEKFEADFTSYHKIDYGVTTSNGTTALQLGLMALGIGPGDEVIVPGFTFVAPANMVLERGGKVVYADIDPLTWGIDPKSVEQCITSRTKAIIVVHLYGNVCNMDALTKIAREHKIYLIEDNAESPFSTYKGKLSGTFGDIGCFSFQATKTITMGEGGFVLTPHKHLYDQMRLIRDHGMRQGKRYWHDVIGYNFRLTNLQAAVGCAQLENLDQIVLKRKNVYKTYQRNLANEVGISLQYFSPDVDAVVWAIALKIDPNCFKSNRDFLINQMLDKGIETRPGFYPFSEMPLYKAPFLPVSQAVGANVLSLPSSPSLTEEEIVFICQTLKGLRN